MVPMMYFTELEQIFQKCIWNHKRPHIAPVTLRNKNKIGAITLPNIKLHIRPQQSKQHGTGIKTDT